ncbi:hypothetical protein EHQ31_04320 [Leptospira montravelensis]|uniref:Lipoprotein n=1 Tax=Leptospira montravelensis TaxID=2484961 RepID=A0ABY2LUQ0_9LEPT|nr:hypothetical protein [Leptospira montravelensis]TGK83933.1 hypothetical protein EHQ19_05285 [Leptospira montravelensis]TGL05940.1 hypothetical protein EHQ31_04320 [Leptospira montravelensis]
MIKYYVCKVNFLLTVFIFYFHCNGIGGPSVIPYENFKNQAESFFYIKVSECGRAYSVNSPDTQSSRSDDGYLLGLLSGAAGKASEILSYAGPIYVTKKDANFCYKAILAVPCGQNISEFLAAYSATYIVHCSPEKACMTSHQNGMQGNFCIR